MEVLLLLVSGAVNLICFVIGAKVGQTAVKGEKIEIPTANPLDLVRQHRAQKAADKKQSEIDAILENINAYDGTPYGQKDIPKG